MNFHTYISKKDSLDFEMTALAFHLKPLGNLKWTPESYSQINTKRCAILLIFVLQLIENSEKLMY